MSVESGERRDHQASRGWLDVSAHPLHVMSFPPRYTYDELDAAFALFREHYVAMIKERPLEEIVLLVDISRVERSEARNRRRISEEMEALAQLMKSRCVAQAYFVERPLIRAALTAVMWLRSAPWPVSVFGKRDEAERWLHQMLRAHVAADAAAALRRAQRPPRRSR